MVYDSDEEEDNGFQGFPMDIDSVKVEDSKLEMHKTEELILPDGHSVIVEEFAEANGSNEKILPDRNEGCNSSIDPIKHEPLEIKDEMNESESEQDECMVDLPGEDESSDEDLDQEGDDSVTNIQQMSAKLRREAKIRGLSYKTRNGRNMPARTVQPNCGTGCKYQCITRVSDEVRHQLLANLLQLSLSEQHKFINDHICIVPSAGRRLVSRRSFTFYHFLPVDSRLVKVCKTMFLNTYSLTEKILIGIRSRKVTDRHVVCGNPNFPKLLKQYNKFYFDYDESCDPTKVVSKKVRKDWCECSQQCWSMFSVEVMEQIQSSFQEMTKNMQDRFLSRHVQLSIDESNLYKSALFRTRYFLPLESTAKEVCRKMFLRTFKLSTSQVKSLLNSLPENPDVPAEVNDSYKFAISDAVPRTHVVLDENNLEDKTPPVEVKLEPLNDEVKLEPVEIDAETSKLEVDHHEFLVVLSRDDDSANEQLLVAPEANVHQNDNSDTDSQSEIISPNIQQPVSSHKKSAVDLRKERKTRGLSYTAHNGRLVPARAVKPNCGAFCKIQCRTRVSEEVREQLLANLLQMPLIDQRKFFNEHICNMPAANPRSLSGRRMQSCHYFLPVDSRLVKVCRTMFVNTYDITNVVLFKNLAKKVVDKHVVCGNPNFPPLLKKGSKFYFEYDEGYDQALAGPQEIREEGCECDLQCGNTFSEEMIAEIQSSFRKKTIKSQHKFLSEHVQLSVGKRRRYKSTLNQARFFLPLGSTVKEVCRKVFGRTFKLTSGQVKSLLSNLSENPNLPAEVEHAFELAKEHIAALRMDEDHHCAVSGGLWKLSYCPNVARMYSEYLERCPEVVTPIEYQQYYAEFGKTFTKTGLQLPTRCPDCGFFDRG